MDRRNIVIFSALYMPHLGGVEKYSQSLAAELSKSSQVTVFCMNTEHQPKIVKEGEVTVYFLPCFPLQKGRFPVPKPSALRMIESYFRQNRVDFAIVQCRFYLLSCFACHLLSRFHVRFIQIEHGAGDVVMPNPIVDRIWHLYDSILTKSEKRISHDYYAVSHAGLRWLEHYGIRGIGVISNSVSPRDFDPALRDRTAFRRSRGIPEDALIITFTGRIMRDKGVADLLEAFDRLKGDNLYLVIAGGGDMDLVRSRMGRDHILFTGQLDFADIPPLLADTQIFCLPSHFVEGKPTGVLEAGYCGCAVVSTNSGGTTEIIPDDEHGKLIPHGDIPLLAETLQYLIDHPAERIEMGRKLHERIVEYFTWETAAEGVYAAMARSDTGDRAPGAA